jgi:hypothetical protein
MLAALGIRQEPAKELDWLLVYFMSYDNNLEQCGPVILDGLEEGAKEGRVAVTVLADFRDKDGLKRFTLTPAGRREETLATDNSASEEVLEEYLAWAAKTHPAKRFAIVFLNHGGDLDDMSLDEQPGAGIAKQWLSARRVGPILKKFRDGVGGKVELVFLQQCGRGSVDNLYNFRGAGSAVMASQTTVGAPNTYYAPTVKWLAKNPGSSGAELARRIMRDDEHYLSYVCVRGDELSELPKRIDAAIEPLLSGPVTAPRRTKPCFGNPREGEANHDLIGWLEAAYADNERKSDALAALESWMKEKLIVHHEFQAEARRKPKWCGVSLYVPATPALFEKYRDYPLYEAGRLDDLWKALRTD